MNRVMAIGPSGGRKADPWLDVVPLGMTGVGSDNSECQASDDVRDGRCDDGTQEIYGIVAEQATALEGCAQNAVDQHAQKGRERRHACLSQ